MNHLKEAALITTRLGPYKLCRVPLLGGGGALIWQIRAVIIWAINDTLSEETPHHTVYHHLSQFSVDIHLSGLIKNLGVQMQMTHVIFHLLD